MSPTNAWQAKVAGIVANETADGFDSHVTLQFAFEALDSEGPHL